MAYTDITDQTKATLAALPSGIYALYGGEEFLKRHFLSDLKKKALSSGVYDFSFSAHFGPEAYGEVSVAASTLPQFADRRVVVWYNSTLPNAQARYKSKIEAVLKEAREYPYLILVLYFFASELDGKDRRQTEAIKKLSTEQLYFDFLPTEKLIRWIYRHFEADGIKVTEKTARLVAERSGRDMNAMVGHIEKLCLYAMSQGRDTVTEADVSLIVAEKVTFSPFFISDCVRSGDREGLLSYIADAKARAVAPQAVLVTIMSEAEKLCKVRYAKDAGVDRQETAKRLKLHENVVRLALGAKRSEARLEEFLYACLGAEAELKGPCPDKYGILRELVCKL